MLLPEITKYEVADDPLAWQPAPPIEARPTLPSNTANFHTLPAPYLQLHQHRTGPNWPSSTWILQISIPERSGPSASVQFIISSEWYTTRSPKTDLTPL